MCVYLRKLKHNAMTLSKMDTQKPEAAKPAPKRTPAKPKPLVEPVQPTSAELTPNELETVFEAVTKPVPYATQPTLTGPADERLELAKDLAKFIADNGLSMKIQQKDYVLTEGWQYAGSRLGIVPIVEHVINVSSDIELKYQAKVTLFDLRSAQTVGAGFAICSNKENGKKFYQEFAIASMAQTRAIGKAYRNILAWIIRAAGYEPTPVEEMEYSGNVPQPVKEQPVMTAVTTANNIPEPALLTAEQKEQIRDLMGYPEITKDERDRIAQRMDRYMQSYAVNVILNLKIFIRQRGGKLPEDETASQDDLDELPF